MDFSEDPSLVIEWTELLVELDLALRTMSQCDARGWRVTGPDGRPRASSFTQPSRRTNSSGPRKPRAGSFNRLQFRPEQSLPPPRAVQKQEAVTRGGWVDRPEGSHAAGLEASVVKTQWLEWQDNMQKQPRHGSFDTAGTHSSIVELSGIRTGNLAPTEKKNMERGRGNIEAATKISPPAGLRSPQPARLHLRAAEPLSMQDDEIAYDTELPPEWCEYVSRPEDQTLWAAPLGGKDFIDTKAAVNLVEEHTSAVHGKNQSLLLPLSSPIAHDASVSDDVRESCVAPQTDHVAEALALWAGSQDDRSGISSEVNEPPPLDCKVIQNQPSSPGEEKISMQPPYAHPTSGVGDTISDDSTGRSTLGLDYSQAPNMTLDLTDGRKPTADASSDVLHTTELPGSVLVLDGVDDDDDDDDRLPPPDDQENNADSVSAAARLMGWDPLVENG